MVVVDVVDVVVVAGIELVVVVLVVDVVDCDTVTPPGPTPAGPTGFLFSQATKSAPSKRTGSSSLRIKVVAFPAGRASAEG